MKDGSVITYIKTVTSAFLILFNAGIIARAAKTLTDGMLDDDIDSKKKVMNLVKASIAVNSIGGMILIIGKYFM